VGEIRRTGRDLEDSIRGDGECGRTGDGPSSTHFLGRKAKEHEEEESSEDKAISEEIRRTAGNMKRSRRGGVLAQSQAIMLSGLNKVLRVYNVFS